MATSNSDGPDPLSDLDIFLNAPLDVSPDQLAAYLDEACAGDPELRARVDALFAADCDTEAIADRAPIMPGNQEPPLSTAIESEGSTIGRYKLLQKIGEGGFGTVYMAEQLQPVKRRVALKIIKLGMDTRQVVARFEAERQALAMMDHPAIAKVYDAGASETGRPYFVMELVRGLPITEFCDTQRLEIRERLALFVQVCHAVQHAHQKGVIHRDLKPSNVMVTMHDDQAMPKVIDFGVAKATQQELTEKTLFTRYEQFIGTPAYTSPEQAQFSGLDIDTRSDIYALGVLLYEILTGEPPFDSRKLLSAGYEEMRRIIREEEPPKPSTRISTCGDAELGELASSRHTDPHKLGVALHGDLDWIVMKTLEKDRTRRYDTANGLAMDIQRHLDDEPVLAAAPSSRYRFSKYLRRHRAPVLTAIALVALLISGVTVSSWQWFRAREAEKRETQRATAESGLRAKAEEGERRQRLIAYASDMKAAEVALKEDDLGRVQRILRRHLPVDGQEDLRGLVWRYLWGTSHSGDEIQTIEHGAIVRGLSVSEDGQHLATMAFDGAVRLFDLPGGQERNRIEGRARHASKLNTVAISPDGRYHAAEQEGVLTVWRTGGQGVILRREGILGSPLFSPGSRYLAAFGVDGIHVWSVEDWEHRLFPRDVPDEAHFARMLAFAPDEEHLLAFHKTEAGNQQHLTIWNLANGRLEQTYPFSSFQSMVTDGKHLIAGNWPGELHFFDLEALLTGTPTPEPIKIIKAHEGLLFGLSVSPDGKTLATGGSDQMIRLWKMEDVEQEGFAPFREFRGHQNEIWHLQFYLDGTMLASASKDQTVKLWRVGREPRRNAVYSIPNTYRCLGFSESGDFLRFVVPGEWQPNSERPPLEHRLNLVDRRWEEAPWVDGKAIADQFPNVWRSAAWHSGQSEVLFGRDDGTVMISDGLRTEAAPLSDKPVEALLLSPSGRYLLAQIGSEEDPDIHTILWDRTRQETVHRFEYLIGRKAAISPDDRSLAYVGDNYSVVLWSIEEKREIAVIEGHTWVIFGVKFSPDSRLLLSFDWASTCRVWNTEDGSPAAPYVLRGHRSGIKRAWITQDRRLIATESDEAFKLSSTATGQELFSQTHRAAARALPLLPPHDDRLVRVLEAEKEDELRIEVIDLPSLEDIDRWSLSETEN